MPTLDLQVATSLGDTEQQSGADNAGRSFTGSGLITTNASALGAGSHGGFNEHSVGIRFPGVDVPQGTTIESATLTLTAFATYDASPNVIKLHVSTQAADNAAALSGTSGDLNTTNRPRSTADAGPWTVTAAVIDTEYSIDVTAIVQEIIDRGGWAALNALVFLLDTHADTTVSEWQDFYSYDGSTTKAPKLQIVYASVTPVNAGRQRDQRRHPKPVMRRIAA